MFIRAQNHLADDSLLLFRVRMFRVLESFSLAGRVIALHRLNATHVLDVYDHFAWRWSVRNGENEFDATLKSTSVSG